jgi:hypothetical protein
MNLGINTFHQNDIDKSFNSFLNTFLIVFDTCFPILHVTTITENNHWITTGIRKSCMYKKSLHICSKTNSSPKIKHIIPSKI